MKLVVTSDWHVDHITNGVRREAEIHRAALKVLEHTLELKETHEVGFMFLGDLCDPDSGREVAAASGLIVAMALTLRDREIPALWLVGNHDVIEDGSGITTLQALPNDRTSFAHHPGRFKFGSKIVLALPFTPTSHTYDPAKVVRETGGAYDIVVGHLSIPGMHPGEETTEMPRGRDVLFPIAETEGKLRLNGHYHKQQSFVPKGSTTPIHIPGSLARLTFGEEDHTPSFLVVDVP